MEDRLKGLKNSMDKTSFSKLNFTEKHRKAIQERMLKTENEEAILIATLQLLVHEKTGYELVKLLRGRGIRKFEESEGIVYTLLHQLEQDGFLHSSWNELNVKYYRLNNKGTKLLRKSERPTIKAFSFKKLVEE